jgi:ankyrin repeat protein
VGRRGKELSDLETPEELTEFELNFVRYYLEEHAVNAKHGPHSETALMIACRMGTPGLVRLVIEQGGDVNSQDIRGHTALMSAVWFGERSESEVLEICQLLVQRGADVNAADANGRSALMWAVSEDFTDVVSYELVKLLLEYGADVSHPDSEEKDALIWAQESESESRIIELLREYKNSWE